MALQYQSLDEAIAKAEGFGQMGAIPTLANNPGDITAGSWATAHGAVGSYTALGGQQIAKFPDVATGYSAEDALIAGNYSGGTLADLAGGWLSGSSAQAQQNWLNTITQQLGVPASTPVSQTAGAALSPATGAPSGPGLIDKAKAALSGATSFALFGPGVSWGRAGAFFLGFIVIAGALYLFKPVQEVVNSTARAGVRAL